MLAEWGIDLIHTPEYFRETLTEVHKDFHKSLNEIKQMYGLGGSHLPECVIEDEVKQRAYREMLESLAEAIGFQFYHETHLERLSGLVSRFPDFRNQGLYPEYSTLRTNSIRGLDNKPIAGNYGWAAHLFLFRASDSENPQGSVDLDNAKKLYGLAAFVELGLIKRSHEYLHRVLRSNAEWYRKFAEHADSHLSLLKQITPV